MLRLLAREGWMTSICRVVMGFILFSTFAIFFRVPIFSFLRNLPAFRLRGRPFFNCQCQHFCYILYCKDIQKITL